MTSREANMLWLRDLIEHLSTCQKQLEWAEEGDSIELLTETMQRDLERCQRLCEAVKQRQREYAVA